MLNMIKIFDKTTIVVTKKTRDRLAVLGNKGSTFEEIILDLLEKEGPESS